MLRWSGDISHWLGRGEGQVFGRAALVTHSRVVECHADGATMMPIVLPNDLLTTKLPESGVVIGACCHQVGGIGTEGAIPHPALMTMQRGF